jgi:hypothetical protein
MESPSSIRDVNMKLMGAVDARAIVPVEDAHGGVTIYYQGRPINYLLAGEWYQARPGPTDPDTTVPVVAVSSRPSLRD